MKPKNDYTNQIYIFAITVWAKIDRKPALVKFMEENCKKWIFQLEECPKTKTHHFQCYVSLKTKKYVGEFKKVLNNSGFSGADVAAASDKGKEKLKNYCMKKESRIAGPWANTHIYLGADLITDLRPWQQDVVNMLSEKPDPRKIHWYYDEKGGKGKSSLAKYMYYHHKVLTLSIGKASDLLNLVFKLQGRKMYVFDISRTVPESIMTEIYMALESVKNGYFVNTKYDTGVCIMETPHVVVFSNMKPKLDALSKDRWVIKDMSKPDEPRKINVRIDSASASEHLCPKNFCFENLSI